MNSVTPTANANDDATAVVNLGNQRKRRGSAPLTDDVVIHRQVQFQQLSSIGNPQQPSSSSSNYINTSGVDPCVHCHRSETMEEMKVAEEEAAFLDSLPIGYRFLPTDEELIVHYLWKKIMNENLPKNRIFEANVYGDHPKDLAANYPQAREGVWYFFSPRDRKYGRGTRPSRSAGSGYWKATGVDKAIRDKEGTKIGGRKSLVFYEGHQPKGTKTSWMMHEYVVEGYERQRLGLDDMKLDDYVLYKIYKNGRMKEEVVTDQEYCDVACSDQDENVTIDIQEQNEQAGDQDANAGDQVIVLDDQQEHVVANNQVMYPTPFQVENNIVVIQHSHQNSNPSLLGSNQDMNPGVITGAKEVTRPVLVRDHSSCVGSSQDLKMGSLYEPMASSIRPVQMTSFESTRAPIMDHSRLTRFDHEYSLQNPPFSPPAGLGCHSLPHLHGHVHTGRYRYEPSSNPPPPPQVASPLAFRDNNVCDGHDNFNQNIELMYAKDGYDSLNLDNSYKFQLFDRYAHMDTDESKKHEALKVEDLRNY